MHHTHRFSRAFTLIELSLVLVIIGLIVGGILVGRSLISAAELSSQITQISKFQLATNTFYGKYGFLPGDIKDPDASNFGFVARGPYGGQGDGDGSIQGNYTNTAAGQGCRVCQIAGEIVVFWRDLGAANLIDQKLTLASSTTLNGSLSGTAMAKLLPTAKINNNYVYVYSDFSSTASGINYFGLSAATQNDSFGNMTSLPNLTVQQAFAMDSKLDDGLPQTGNVTAQYVTWLSGAANVYWAGTSTSGGAYTTAAAGSATSCFDNSSSTTGTPGMAGAIQHYSIEMTSNSLNCALSFRIK